MVLFKKLLIFGYCSFFLLNCLLGQDYNKIDSLVSLIENSTTKQKIDICNRLAIEYRSISIDSANFFAFLSLNNLYYTDYVEGEADYYYAIAMIYKQQSNFNESLSNFHKAMELYKAINHIQGICDVYTGIGDIYEYQENYSLAIEYYNKALKLGKENNLKSTIAQNYNNLGVIIKYTDPEKAINLFNKAIELFNELNDKNSVSICYNNIGILYSNLGIFEKQRNFS